MGKELLYRERERESREEDINCTSGEQISLSYSMIGSKLGNLCWFNLFMSSVKLGYTTVENIEENL